MHRIVFLCVMGVLAASVLPASAEPGPNTRQAMETAFSEFDFYLFKVSLNETIAHRGIRRFSGLHYDYDQSLLYLYYSLDARHDSMRSFSIDTENRKKETLKRHLKKIVDALGVKAGSRTGTLRVGGVSLVDVDIAKRGFNRQAFHNEMAERTVVVLRVRLTGKLYELKRTVQGDYEYQVSKAK